MGQNESKKWKLQDSKEVYCTEKTVESTGGWTVV